MNTFSRHSWLPAIVLVGCWAAAARAQEPAAPTKDAGPAAYFEAVNRIWTEADLTRLPTVLGSDVAVVIRRGANVLVFDRAGFADALARFDPAQAGLVSHRCEMVSSVHRAGLALCQARTEDRLRNGQTRRSDAFFVLHKTPEGWRLVFAMPVAVRLQAAGAGGEAAKVILPGRGAATEGPQAEAIKAELRAHIARLQRKDAEAAGAAFAPEAFVDCAARGDKTEVLSRQRWINQAKKSIEAGTIQPDSLAAADVRVIHQGPLALAEVDYTFRDRDGKEGKASCLHALVRRADAWRIVANVTSLAHIQAATEDEKAVRKLAQLYVAPVGVEGRVPLAKVAEFLADDVIGIWSDGRPLRGKAQWLKRNTEAIAEVRRLFTRFEARYTIRQVSVFTDVAVVVGDVRLAGTLKEGDKAWSRAIWMTLIFHKTPHGWRLIQEHSTRAANPPPPN